MQQLELKHLSLRAPLLYRGVENPPFRGLASAAAAALGPGPAAAAFGEELFIFEAEALVAFDPEEGPRLAPSPLPAPSFYGRLAAGEAEGEAPYALAPGPYLFMQWRPEGEAELREGLEFFAREAWWEGERTRGPYLIRRLGEDGKVATQVWRSVEA